MFKLCYLKSETNGEESSEKVWRGCLTQYIIDPFLFVSRGTLTIIVTNDFYRLEKEGLHYYLKKHIKGSFTVDIDDSHIVVRIHRNDFHYAHAIPLFDVHPSYIEKIGEMIIDNYKSHVLNEYFKR